MNGLHKILASFFFVSSLTQVAYSNGEVRKNYQVYKPQITFQTVDVAHGHDASIVYFDGQWIAQWDDGTEKLGQKIRQSTSKDLITWSKPIEAYSSAQGSVNPVTEPTLWQPSLVVKGKTLYSLYKGAPNLWLGKLSSSSGKWENTALYGPSGNGAKYNNPQFDNEYWDIYAGNNGIVSSTGRIVIPVTLTMIDNPAAGKKREWIERAKRDSIIYSDDNGTTWQYSTGTSFGDGTQSWEATVWQPAPEVLNLVSRNNRTTLSPPRENLKGSSSFDNGKTWDQQTLLNIDSAMSRPHAMRVGQRNILVQNDWFHTQTAMKNRRNLSLYFSRGNRVDEFVAGLPILDGAASTTVIDYPQMAVNGATLAIIYSRDVNPRVTRVATISPLPADTSYYIFPRNGHSNIESVKVDGKNALRFNDDYSSAGIDLDSGSSGSTLDIAFAIKPETQKRQTIFSLSSKVKLVTEKNKLYLLDATPQTKNKPQEIGLISSTSMWSTVFISANSNMVSARIGNNGTAKQISLASFPWQAYFGDDVYSDSRQKSAGQKFLIDVDSVITRVK